MSECHAHHGMGSHRLQHALLPLEVRVHSGHHVEQQHRLAPRSVHLRPLDLFLPPPEPEAADGTKPIPEPASTSSCFSRCGVNAHAAAGGPLPRPHELCASDPVAPLSSTSHGATFWPRIQLNAPLEELFPMSVDVAPRKMQLALETHAAQPHLLVRDGRQRSSQLHLILQVHATADDAITAMLHAVCVRCATCPGQSTSLYVCMCIRSPHRCFA